ncbi:rod shape-determining protein MreD [Marinobacteraceae bacterium S3BR75-40.1]
MILPAVHYPTFFVSLILAFVGSIALFPATWVEWRPEWVGLMVFYWVFRAPFRFGIFFAAFVGLLLDVLEGTTLGINALSMAVIAFLVLSAHQRLRMFPIPQQSLMVFLLLGINQMIVHFIKQVLGDTDSGFDYLLPAVTSAVLWPPVCLLLDLLNRKLR